MYVCMITTTDMFLLYMTSFKNAWFLNEWSINLFSSLKLEKIITIEYFPTHEELNPDFLYSSVDGGLTEVHTGLNT